jgi:hypothetical protein
MTTMMDIRIRMKQIKKTQKNTKTLTKTGAYNMRIQTIIFSLALSLFSAVAFAGAGHDHGHSHDPVTQSKAEAIAAKSVSRLVEKGKIDTSWKAVTVAKSEKKKFGGETEWVVSFKNDKVSDPSKQTLYIFLTLGGEYLAANYTGK